MEYSPNARNKEKNTFAKDFILPLVETVEMQDFPFRGFGQSAKTYCLLGTYYFLQGNLVDHVEHKRLKTPDWESSRHTDDSYLADRQSIHSRMGN